MVNALLGALILFLAGLAGEWKGTGEDADEQMTLRPDGTGTLAGVRLAWREDGEVLVLRFDGVPQDVRFKFRLAGDALHLQDEEGETATYRRVGAAAAETPKEAPPKPATSTSGSATAYEDPRGVYGFDVPQGWTARLEGDTTWLVPPDAAQGYEVHGVSSRPLEGASGVQDPLVVQFFDEQTAQIAPFLSRTSTQKLKDDGLELNYAGENPEGKRVRAQILARTLGKSGAWVGSLAIEEHFLKREAALRAVHASLRAAKPVAAGAGGDAKGFQGTQPAWLVGLWSSSERTGDLSTRTTDTTLYADGTFEYRWMYLTKSINGGIAYSNEISRAGRWSFAGGVLTMEFDRARDRWQYPPAADSVNAQARWDLPVTQGVDPASGRAALYSNGERISVKQR